jgi:hypothetical protein
VNPADLPSPKDASPRPDPGLRITAQRSPVGRTLRVSGEIDLYTASALEAEICAYLAVISQAAAGDPQVKALVYIAALVPDKGENLGTPANKFPGTNELASVLRPVPFSNSDGTGGSDLYVDPTLFRAVFAADLPASQTVVTAAEQRPIAAAAFAASATAAAWHTIPSWALVARQDAPRAAARRVIFRSRALKQDEAAQCSVE